MSNNTELSTYMQFITGIKAPGNREERDDWSKMRSEVLRSLASMMLLQKNCDCPCGQDFLNHLSDLENHPEFRKHFLMLANVLQKYPELASSFIAAACIRTSSTDWDTIEDNTAHCVQ